MEKTKEYSLPAIFKLSVLSNLLPYFGFLHEWKIILKSMNKKTKQIWDKNIEAFMYLGREYKFKLIKYLLRSRSNFDMNIPTNPELFTFEVIFSCFLDSELPEVANNTQIMFNKLTNLLINQLNESKGIFFNKSDSRLQLLITFLSENELVDICPSIFWKSFESDVKKFSKREGNDLILYILEKINTKKVVIRKLETDEIEVNSVAPHPIWNTQNYNILNPVELEKIKNLYSCPIYNWIWKPTTLWWISDTNLDTHRKFNLEPKENIVDDITDDIVEEILRQPLLENIKQLNIVLFINNFSSIENLLKIYENFKHLKIEIRFKYNWEQFEYSFNWYFKDSQLGCIFKGRECWLEAFYEKWNRSLLNFTDFIPVENEDFVVLKISNCIFYKLVLISNQILNKRMQSTVNKIKRLTEFNDDFYIIIDRKKVALFPIHPEPSWYIPIFKYFNLIELSIWPLKPSWEEKIKMINELPKDCYYEVRANVYDLLKSKAYNLIDSSFETIVVKTKRYIIRFKNLNSIDDNKDSKRMFTVFDNYSLRLSVVDSKKLKEMLINSHHDD